MARFGTLSVAKSDEEFLLPPRNVETEQEMRYESARISTWVLEFPSNFCYPLFT